MAEVAGQLETFAYNTSTKRMQEAPEQMENSSAYINLSNDTLFIKQVQIANKDARKLKNVNVNARADRDQSFDPVRMTPKRPVPTDTGKSNSTDPYLFFASSNE